VKLAADGSPYARNRRDAVEALRAMGGPQTATAIVEALDGVIRDGSHFALHRGS